jgi:hypothetical protein
MEASEIDQYFSGIDCTTPELKLYLMNRSYHDSDAIRSYMDL